MDFMKVAFPDDRYDCPAKVSPRWTAFVDDFLSLYVRLTNPDIQEQAAELTFPQKCLAITHVSRVNGHSWMPLCGEDFARLAELGIEPHKLFHSFLSENKHGAWNSRECWPMVITIASDSTLTFGHSGKANAEHFKHFIPGASKGP